MARGVLQKPTLASNLRDEFSDGLGNLEDVLNRRIDSVDTNVANQIINLERDIKELKDFRKSAASFGKFVEIALLLIFFGFIGFLLGRI